MTVKLKTFKLDSFELILQRLEEIREEFLDDNVLHTAVEFTVEPSTLSKNLPNFSPKLPKYLSIIALTTQAKRKKVRLELVGI